MTHALYARLAAASRWNSRLRRRTLLLLVLAVNVVHPLLHGTPLDGGALDGLLATLNNQVATDNSDD